MEESRDAEYVLVDSRPASTDGSLDGGSTSSEEEIAGECVKPADNGEEQDPCGDWQDASLGGVQDGGKSELIRQLTGQVTALQSELEVAHAANHKLLEATVGPRYAAELGPTEGAPTSSKPAPVYAGAQAGLQGTRSEMASVEHLLDSTNPPAAGGRPRHGVPAAAPNGGAPRAADAGEASSGKGNNAAAEKQRRQLEAALDLQKGKVRDLQMKLEALTESHDVLKERQLAAEHRAFQNARALAAQVEAARERAAGEQAAANNAAAQIREQHAEELNILRKLNDELRRQVQQAQDSIPELIRARTQESAARKAQEAASRAAFEARRDESVKAARDQLRREADVLRAQLAQANQQLAAANSRAAEDLKHAHDSSTKAINSLSDELRSVYLYAAQLEEIIEGVRTGKYPTVLKENFQRVSVPTPGGPVQPADRARLRQLAAAHAAAKKAALALEADVRLQNLQREVAALKERLAQYESAGSLQGAREVLATEVRKQVEAEVMQELQASSTVEYVSCLEAENMRLRQTAQASARQELSQNIALQSYRRVEERTATRKGRHARPKNSRQG